VKNQNLKQTVFSFILVWFHSASHLKSLALWMKKDTYHPMKIWRQVSQEYLLPVISEKKAYVKSLRQQVMAVLLQKWHRNTLKHQHLSLNKIQKSNYFLT